MPEREKALALVYWEQSDPPPKVSPVPSCVQLPLSAVWAFVYALLFSSERYYISSIPLVLILCIVTNPQIFAGVPLGRMLTVLGRVFPAWVVRL